MEEEEPDDEEDAATEKEEKEVLWACNKHRNKYILVPFGNDCKAFQQKIITFRDESRT